MGGTKTKRDHKTITMTITDQILEVASEFERLGCEFAFLGGAVLQVLLTDRAVAPVRVTKDVDVLVNTPTRSSYTKLEEMLRRSGFKNDTSEGAPLCRYVFKGIVVDVMPTTHDVLGWDSKWFGEALSTAQVQLLEGRSIKILAAPYYIATKIEAFEGRGKRDFLCSHDLEDIICLMNGREEVVDEVQGSPQALRLYLAEKFQAWVQHGDFLNAVEGFLVTENEPSARRDIILQRFKHITDMT